MKTVVYTGGTFDILHAGHINFFRKIKQLFPDCELSVSLNTDEFIEEYKGKKPIFSYEERKNQLACCSDIYEIVKNEGGVDSKITIERIFDLYLHRIDNYDRFNKVIAIGQDWLAKDYCKQMGFDHQWLTDQNISLVYIPHTDGISTTEIKQRLQK